jgi:hypothetical protein
MAEQEIIFTNHALSAMGKWHLSEADVMDAFNKGETENAKFGGKWNAVRKYHGYEVGVNYDQRDGKWIIVSVWKRGRY